MVCRLSSVAHAQRNCHNTNNDTNIINLYHIRLMKKILLSLALVAAVAISSFAAQTTITVKSGTYTNILVGNGRLSQFVLTSTTANTNYLTFLDSPSTNAVYVVGAYSNLVTQTGVSFTNIYTNYLGVLTTNTYTGIREVTNSVAAATNSYNTLMTAVVSPNSTLTIGNANTFPYGSAYYYYQGVGVTNSGGGDAIITLTFSQ